MVAWLIPLITTALSMAAQKKASADANAGRFEGGGKFSANTGSGASSAIRLASMISQAASGDGAAPEIQPDVEVTSPEPPRATPEAQIPEVAPPPQMTQPADDAYNPLFRSIIGYMNRGGSNGQ